MPSIVYENPDSEQDLEDFGRADGIQVDTLVLESMAAEFVFSRATYDKARNLLMDDLRHAGASVRQLERWFGVGKSTLGRRYAGFDPPPIPDESRRYHRRLTEVVEENPPTFADLVTAIQRKAGTSAQTGKLLFMLGSRARSAEVALGSAQKARRKQA